MTVCPRCTNGTWTDSNGVERRCHYCNGTGKTEETTPADLLEINDGDYVLQVRNEAMTGAGILPGDYIIVRQQDTAADGQIVVALIGEEATVRRYYRTEDGVRLEAANDKIEPVTAPDVKVLGVVVAVMRTVS